MNNFSTLDVFFFTTKIFEEREGQEEGKSFSALLHAFSFSFSVFGAGFGIEAFKADPDSDDSLRKNDPPWPRRPSAFNLQS